MAITETRNLPAPFIQSLGEYYGKELPALTKDPIDVTQFAPQVSPQDTLQTQAATLAGQTGKGIGSFEQYLTAAEPYAGPDAYKQFMSPYQQQVIDATMTSFDKQAAQQRRGISDRAAQLGAYGGSRMGVAQSEYDAASDMNRALMESQLLQQGYGQGMAGAQTAFQQQPNPTPLQTALGTGATLAGIYGAVRGAGQQGYQAGQIPVPKMW